MTEGDARCVISLSSCRIRSAEPRISATDKLTWLLSTLRARKGELSTQHLHFTSSLCQHTGETLHILQRAAMSARDNLDHSLKCSWNVKSI